MKKGGKCMKRWARNGLFLLVLAVAGLFLFTSQTKATISSKVPDLEMDLEQIEMNPIPLDASK
jgi:hypothetical protein